MWGGNTMTTPTREHLVQIIDNLCIDASGVGVGQPYAILDAESVSAAADAILALFTEQTAPEQPREKVYYLQRVPSGFLGNAIIFWRIGDSGYTAYLEGAREFSEEEALAMEKHNPEKWKAWPCDEIKKRVHLVFDIQDAGRIGETPIYDDPFWPMVDARQLLSRKTPPITDAHKEGE